MNHRVAIISGALGDIGRAIAMDLARRGADIALGDVLADDQAQSLLSELQKLGRRARYDRVDVADVQAVRGWVSRVEQELGPANWIIPNAAIVTQNNIQSVTAEDWKRHFQVNLDGAFYLAQAAAQVLIQRKLPGRIVFIGSWAAHRPLAGLLPYCVAKAGLRMLCKCMALEYGPNQILVNEVAPGYVDAGLTGKIFEKNPLLRRQAIRRVPIGALIEPADVAREVGHLCEEAHHSTGSVLLMDGGLSLLSGNEATREET
jgi:glucose 1-dehydrogenase